MSSTAAEQISVSYQLGRHCMYLVFVGIAVIIAWRKTAPWRSCYPAAGATQDEVVRSMKQRTLRHQISVTGAASIVVVSLVVSIATWHPTRAAAAADSKGLTFSAPAAVGGYTLVTGDRAEALVAGASVQPPQQGWFYTGPDSGSAALLVADLAAKDSRLRSDLTTHTAHDLVTYALSTAGATGTQRFPAGPMGGELRCGHKEMDQGQAVLCAWVDASMLVYLQVPDAPDPAAAAKVTLAFRAKAEKWPPDM